jgi:hypothetical protein
MDAEKLAVAEKHIGFIFFKVVLNNSERRFHFCFGSFANGDWHCPTARIDLVVGGSFTYTMAARHDMQRAGWQMILDRFKNYVESLNS